MSNYVLFIFAAFCHTIANMFKDCHNQRFPFLQLLWILRTFYMSICVLAQKADFSFHRPILSETEW